MSVDRTRLFLVETTTNFELLRLNEGDDAARRTLKELLAGLDRLKPSARRGRKPSPVLDELAAQHLAATRRGEKTDLALSGTPEGKKFENMARSIRRRAAKKKADK